MVKGFDELPDSAKWRLMVEAAKQGAISQGYTLAKMPGRGLSNIWTITKNGKTQRACIRTTRDRWFAFPPLEKGKKWKTLNEVEVVIVSAVDVPDDPKNVLVFMFPADDVRARFDAAYAARKKANKTPTDNFGMWIGLDHVIRDHHDAVGSGIAGKYKPIAAYSMQKLVAQTPNDAAVVVDENDDADIAENSIPAFTTIAEIMAWTREKVAEIAGVRTEAVKLDLKVEY